MHKPSTSQLMLRGNTYLVLIVVPEQNIYPSALRRFPYGDYHYRLSRVLNPFYRYCKYLQLQTFDLLLYRLPKLCDHLRDRCGSSVWLVKLDVVTALVGNQLLAIG